MQHMYDQALPVQKRDERGLDVNDIIYYKKKQSLPIESQGPIRVAPIKPRANPYDIINPAPSEQHLRMSLYGKNVISGSRQGIRDQSTASPAGVKKVAKLGDPRVEEIWPADEALRDKFNEKNRALDTHDINKNSMSVRMQRIKDNDRMRVEQILASKAPESQLRTRTYKNESMVFGHLVDDPAFRQKPMAPRASSRGVQPDLMRQNSSAQAERDSNGLPLPQGNMKTGKRANTKDYMSVATGQARLFGQDADGPSKEEATRRKGKRQFQARPLDAFNPLQ